MHNAKAIVRQVLGIQGKWFIFVAILDNLTLCLLGDGVETPGDVILLLVTPFRARLLDTATALVPFTAKIPSTAASQNRYRTQWAFNAVDSADAFNGNGTGAVSCKWSH